MESVKCVVVGDGTVGKTSLLITYTTNCFPTEYIPTVFDHYTTKVMHNGTPFELNLWDTAGQEGYDRIRPLSYPMTDVFLVCYSVADTTSLFNVKEKWVPEIKHFCPHTPIFLIGTKSDLRTDPETLTKLKSNNQSIVTTEEAQAICKQIGATKHIECSALRQKKVDLIFQDVISVGKEPPLRIRRNRLCSIL